MSAFYLLWKKEWLSIWHDRSMRVILFLVPLASLALLYFIYSPGVLFHIPAAVVDLDRSGSSRITQRGDKDGEREKA